MKMADIPFQTVDWSQVETTEHPGTTGKATWRTRQFGEIRVCAAVAALTARGHGAQQ